MISSSRRFDHGFRCPVCDGIDSARRGRGERCSGFLSDDGRFAHCSRVEAPGRRIERGGTWPHFLDGPCRCGTPHVAPAFGSLPVAPVAPVDFSLLWRSYSEASPVGIEYLEGRELWPLPPGVVRFDVAERLYRVAVRLFDAAGRIVGIERRAVRDDASPKVRCLAGSTKVGSTFGALSLIYVGRRPPVWIVEGLADYLAAVRISGPLGVEVLGLPGAGFASTIIAPRAERLRGRRVFVSMDADRDGELARAELVEGLLEIEAEPIVAPYPSGFRDLAETPEGCRADVISRVTARAEVST